MAALNTLDGVADSAVVALPDDRLGELPRRILIALAIPRFGSGKVDREGGARAFASADA